MSSPLGPGTVIAGRYRLDRLLGQGGMGQVWAATHEVTLRAVALKFLNTPVHLRPDRRRRFYREARAASAVRHPNVVQVHDFFELEDDTPVMVMDLLEGETLGQRLAREHSLSLEEAIKVFMPVVSAVGTAHSIGIVHRDLKPDNVFLARSSDGRLDVRVLDFGIAKLTSIADGDTEDSAALTGTGAMLGTPSYMSPEQSFGDKDVDHRTDIWSIGVMLYEALAGTKPIDGETIGRVLHRLTTEAITPIEVLAPELPTEVADLVGRMLTRDPAGRPKDLREVHATLSKYADVDVLAFDAATQERPLVIDSNPSNAALSSRAVIPLPDVCDPDAATFASDPPVPTSTGLATADGAELPVPKRVPSKTWMLLLGAVGLLAVGSGTTWLLLGTHGVGPGPDDQLDERESASPKIDTPEGVETARALAPTSSAPSGQVAPERQTSAAPSATQAPDLRQTARAPRPRADTWAPAPTPSASVVAPRPTAPRDPSEALVDEPPF